MANHIFNTLHIVGSKEQVREVLDFIKLERWNETDYIDFNKIIPAPEELIDSKCYMAGKVHTLLFGPSKVSIETNIEEIRKWFSELNKEKQMELCSVALQYEINLKKYNYATKIDWIREHWGAKWAYIRNHDLVNAPEVIEFISGNDLPLPILKEISKRFPKVLLELKYDFLEASENNSGTIKYRKGHTVSEVHCWEGIIGEEEMDGEDEFLN